MDGARLAYSSLPEERPEGVVALHLLGEGDCFNLGERRPILAGHEQLCFHSSFMR